MSSVTIDPNISMGDLLGLIPGAQRALFMRYHIGGCSSCGFRLEETLAQVCQRNQDLPVSEVIAHLQTSHAEDQKILIKPSKVSEIIASGEGVQIVDIRTREEFDAARIKGSTLFTQDLMQEILGGWAREALLVIVDHQGKRVLDAATFFAGHGFTNVRALEGGIDAWSVEVDSSIPRYELEPA
jgi:rhodanese-related sulfurtransferase